MHRIAVLLSCFMALLMSFAHGQSERKDSIWGELPTSLDPPFAPRNIDPETATIAPSPGFPKGRYDIEITLSETTLYDSAHRPTRNYVGRFAAQALVLPTDDFGALSRKEFKHTTDQRSSVTLDFVEKPGRVPSFAQQYPVVIESLRFGPERDHVVYAELSFQVDFAASGPPHPWTRMAAINPYQLARMHSDAAVPGYPNEQWAPFCALVRETDLLWSKARYSTNIHFFLNHRYHSSIGMNTHER